MAPRYTLTDETYIARRPGEPRVALPAGTEIEYAGIPGRTLMPLDAEARAAKAAAEAARPTPKRGSMARMLRPAGGGGLAEIPADWRDLPALAKVTLARRLGAPLGTNREAAERFIADELARRATV